MGLFGIPYQAITSNIQLNVKVENIDDLFIKEYSTKSQHTEYVAPYYGYLNQNKAMTVSKSKAFQKAIFNILEQISNDDLDLLQEQILKNKKEEEQRIQNEIEQQRKVRLITVYGEKLANIILNKQIFIGMPESALIESWGATEQC